MSYSYYLMHGLTLKAGFYVLVKALPSGLHGNWLFFTLLPPMFALTLVSSSLLYIMIERPFSLRPKRIG